LGDPSTSDVWRATGEELLASNREQETLIEALLTLASSEGGLDHREPVDLAVIARSVLLDRRDSNPLGLDIDTTLASAPVDGGPRLVESLVANLVDNALTHNNEGGRVEVATGCTDGCAVLTVTNTGPVIPPTEIQRLFQPFQRLDPYRIHHDKGHGLGLSIVRAIATAHGAVITAQPSPQGGISIEVAFPPPDPHESGNARRSPTKATMRTRPVPRSEPAKEAAPPGRRPTVPSESH
jgi:signal transduction histidine kinase